MPFDEFTIEQLAGDLLPDADASQRIATGFTATVHAQPARRAINDEDARVEQVVDRVNTTATVWLAATFECAQCHDHKYDPIRLDEYYRLFAFFNNTPIEGELHTDLPLYRYGGPKLEVGMQSGLEPQLARLKTIQMESLQHQPSAQLTDEKKRRLAAAARNGLEWRTLEVDSFAGLAGEHADRQQDGSMLISGPTPVQSTYTVRLHPGVKQMTALQIEALPDPSLPAGGPGRNSEGGFVLNEVELWRTGAGGRERIPLRDPAVPLQPNSPFRYAVDGDAATGWAVTENAAGKTASIVLELAAPFADGSAGSTIEVVLHHSAGRSLSIGRLRLAATSDDAAVVGLDEKAKALLCTSDRSERDERWLTNLAQTLIKNDPTGAEENQRAQQKVREIRSGQVSVMEELPERRTTHVFLRGNHLTPGEAVTPGTPAALPPMGDDLPRNRLGLARWIVDPANPLTARVAVNRWWADVFGRGIIYSLEDFGTQASLPTHPDLLDWLARELVENGWSRKHVLRLIVTSATYRQSSHVAQPEGERIDPSNTLLWRSPRLRLPAETIRDQALAVGGLLFNALGGPPIYPPQPAGLWNHEGGFIEPPYLIDRDIDRFRRGVYVVWRRGSPYPPFTIFDAPDRSACTVSRSRTATPLQALVLLNDESFVEAALGLANRVLSEKPDEDVTRQLKYAFRLVLLRDPTDAELRTLAAFLQRENVRFASDPAETSAMLDAISPQVPRPPSTHPPRSPRGYSCRGRS